MELQLIRELTPTHKEIYFFEVNERTITYKGLATVHRDTQDHPGARPWGDEWETLYAKERKTLKEQFEEIEESHGSASLETYEAEHTYHAACAQYNPVRQVTNEGKPFYRATFAQANQLPTIPWSPEELRALLVVRVCQAIKDATLLTN